MHNHAEVVTGAELLAVLLFANLARIPTVDLCLPNSISETMKKNIALDRMGGLKLTVLQCIDNFFGWLQCRHEI